MKIDKLIKSYGDEPKVSTIVINLRKEIEELNKSVENINITLEEFEIRKHRLIQIKHYLNNEIYRINESNYNSDVLEELKAEQKIFYKEKNRCMSFITEQKNVKNMKLYTIHILTKHLNAITGKIK